ncbi:MAG TPA: DUF6680 family protein [Methylomirabilota bacterium]|nr:DUF6680 family protein [Methylomirabilota bacterium]
MTPLPTHWGLTISEWLTILAIILGPIIAVLTQLGIQRSNSKRDEKMRVFKTFMGLRATWVQQDFVQAFNLVDVIFYKNLQVRQKRKELFTLLTSRAGADLIPDEVMRANDLFAEMLAMIGHELGYDFGHTEIKGTAYLPTGQQRLADESRQLMQQTLAVMEGRQNLGVVIRTEEAQQPQLMRRPER